MDAYDNKICCVLPALVLVLGRISFYQSTIDNNIVFYTSEKTLKKENKLFFYIKVNRDCCEFISDLGTFKCDLKDRVDALCKIRERKEVFKAIVEHYPEYKRVEPSLYIYSKNTVPKNINVEENRIVAKAIDEPILDNPILCGGIYILWNDDDIQMVDWYTRKRYKIGEEDIPYLFELNFNNNFSAEECYNNVDAYKEKLNTIKEYEEDKLSMYSSDLSLSEK